MTARKLLTAMAGVLLVSVVGTTGLASAVAQTDDANTGFGKTTWPPDKYADYEALPRLAQGALNASAADTLVLGPDKPENVSFDRVGPNNVEITVQTRTEQYSFVQEHQDQASPDRPDPETTPLHLAPNQLTPMIRVHGPASSQQGSGSEVLLSIGAAPGGFNLSGDTRSERMGALLEQLELTKLRENGSGSLETNDDSVRLRSPYGIPAERCRTDNGSSCPELELRCEECTGVTWRLYPDPAEELTEQVNGEIDVGTQANRLWTVFDSDDHLVFVRVSMAIDLDPSAVVRPDRARAQVVQFLEQKGYELTPDNPRENMTTVRLEFRSTDDDAGPEEAEYHWWPVVASTSSEAASGSGSLVGDIRQDAVSGEVRNATFGPHGVPGPGAGSSDSKIPLLSGLLVALLLGAVGTLIRRRGHA